MQSSSTVYLKTKARMYARMVCFFFKDTLDCARGIQFINVTKEGEEIKWHSPLFQFKSLEREDDLINLDISFDKTMQS